MRWADLGTYWAWPSTLSQSADLSPRLSSSVAPTRNRDDGRSCLGLLWSLGYEPTDVRLRCLGQSLVTALTSADLRREVAPGLLHLSRLSLSRRVRFTNRFTKPVLDLRLSALPRRERAHSGLQVHPVTVSRPHVERATTGGISGARLDLPLLLRHVVISPRADSYRRCAGHRRWAPRGVVADQQGRQCGATNTASGAARASIART